MSSVSRVFIFGAGFSKPAGIPLANELLPHLTERVQHEEMRGWLESLRERLAWLEGGDQQVGSFRLNIEEVFHRAHFDMEVYRLRQQLARVGRRDGPGTPWNTAESIRCWLLHLEDALRDIILDSDERADLAPITRWAENVKPQDTVLTFNYDTLVERALESVGQTWNHGTGREDDSGIPVCKLHGSIDWIVAHRSEASSRLCLLFDKENTNRRGQETGDVEDDYLLWRCRTRQQLRQWILNRDLQSGQWRTVGIAGLGAYKPLHRIPGLGPVWDGGMRALLKADLCVVVGFSMSDFDAMAQMHFAEIARYRLCQGRPLRVRVIDPFNNPDTQHRFRRVFRTVDFVAARHEEFDWTQIS